MSGGPGRTSAGHSARARGVAGQAAKKQAWLEAFASVFTVSAACKRADVGRATVYEWRDADEAFAEAWADINEANIEELEAEARRRAYKGVVKPVTIAGQRDEVTEYSDSLLQFLLRALKPSVYRDRATVEHTGPGGGPVQVASELDVSKLSRDDVLALDDLLSRARDDS